MNTNYLKKSDKKHVWHPFTQMKEWTLDEILVIDEGKGAYLKSSSGKWYLDAISSLWVTVHGHNNKYINNAIIKQIKKLEHSTLLGLANTPSILLAEKLVKLAPEGLEKVFYSDCGATSVEIAIKMAYQYWKLKNEKRPYLIKFKNTYHGDTIGAVSAGGMELFHDIFKDLLFKTLEIPWPHTYWKPHHTTEKEWMDSCLLKLEETLNKNKDKVFAIITEPLIQGASGMSTAPKGFLKAVEKTARKHDVLLIVDEVATGFGRTGKMFACEWENVKPDIMCTAKGLTGGYLPLAATLSTNKIYNAFLGDYKEYKTFFHGHTYTGNPLACSAALATIELFKKNKTLLNLKPKINFLSKELSELKKLKHVGDIRQVGFMAGVEVVKDKAKQIPYPLEEKTGMRICKSARTKNVILRPLGNVIVLMPPFIITKKEIKYLVEVIKDCIIKETE